MQAGPGPGRAHNPEQRASTPRPATIARLPQLAEGPAQTRDVGVRISGRAPQRARSAAGRAPLERKSEVRVLGPLPLHEADWHRPHRCRTVPEGHGVPAGPGLGLAGRPVTVRTALRSLTPDPSRGTGRSREVRASLPTNLGASEGFPVDLRQLTRKGPSPSRTLSAPARIGLHRWRAYISLARPLTGPATSYYMRRV